MADYTLPSRHLPVVDSFDILVAGGGPAGCAAAVAAARDGARVLLVEATGCLGGMGTAGLVTCWCPFSDGEKIIYRGIAEEIFQASREGVPHVPAGQVDWVPFDPEQLKRVYDDAVTRAGVTVLFNTFLCGVEMASERRVGAVLTGSKSGLSAIKAKVYLDCTGDGDLATWAGAEYAKGDDETGELQPTTHCFMLTNVDEYAYGLVPKDNLFGQVQASDRYPLVKDQHGCNSLIGPATVGFNSGHLWDVDNTDPASVSRALMQGRQLAKQLRDGLAEFCPSAFGNAYLAQTAPLLGIRETRRIVGDYVVTLEDYLARRSFPDEIGRNNYPIDIHTTKQEAESGQRPNVMERFEQFGPGESHGIPYRSLIPRDLDNVLVAGRSISTDRIVQGSTRVMPPCLVMGQAAGTAAVMAIQSEDVRSVAAGELCGRLLAAGAYITPRG